MLNIRFLFILLLGFQVYGQQVPQYSQYMRNQYMVNPASTGMYDFLDISIGGRTQWVGFDNAPRTAFFYVATPLPLKPKNKGTAKYSSRSRRTYFYKSPKVSTGKPKHAVGGHGLIDQYGAFQRINISGTYAFHLPLSRDFNLSFGTNIGLSNHTFIKERAQTLNLITGSGTDNVYDQFANSGDMNILDIGAGFYLYSRDLFFGISGEQLTEDLVQFGSGTNTFFNTRIHFRGILGYTFNMNRDWEVTPSVLFKYLPSKFYSLDFNAIFEYKQWLWLGLGYRVEDAVAGMFGVNINDQFKLGYSYDYTISTLNNVSSGSHELVLGFMFGR